MTLARLATAGVPEASTEKVRKALDEVAIALTLPVEVLRQSPNLSPHHQQSLYVALLSAAGADRSTARQLIPAHPREAGAYDSYARILKRCHNHLLGIGEADRRHTYYALMAMLWMRGIPLPQIIGSAIDRKPEQNTRRVIRDTLDTIEKVIGFDVVRLMSCYCAVLSHVFDESGFPELSKSIPTVALYLEVGASDRSMISFMSLGLSRVTAAILNEATVHKGMTTSEARTWLSGAQLEAYDLSPMLIEEIRRAVR